MSVDRARYETDELAWFKSSYSAGDGGQCVEVAVRPHVVHVRDSKDIARRGLAVDAAAWTAFVGFAVR
ncbi:DUF397 domain-containing protein [Streptomyces ipomoeae]|jgi:hypothetical protein|uniref:DUF397 domain-containing protein n=1 Tax=Streptomyces ipomoeae TaxID=103232 RepID=UPI0006624C3F|nr:DUF397 domain-containing protein [Streptomyces ipomoeae]MDX2694159.1 DUF397 domain-containing protein [Streptomyces ipomoeae]MDX2821568.1 DUF397 domain-containing protein [Streptomyces ipomoeae]MDX2840265.1 DUF397 domain-containing protein [Streptomyces ipomoeae]MDX2873109.1 DUF397 domain-containing protein [Streptomyces ipomoeae]TQE33730.1 DUF397 domain-containing protein [Streptomyces ipomoeae]